MSDFVPTIDTLGDAALTDSIIDRSITEFLDQLTTSIGANSFYNCSGLTSISLPAAASIGASAFSGCSNLTSVSLPAATSIDASAFIRCSGLTSISLPAAASIGANSFYNCYGLKSISLPATASIGASAFSGCSGLTSISFPAAASIGASAFSGCSKLEALILSNADAVCTLSSTNAFSSTLIASGTGYIYVPAALVDSYKAATNWSTYADQIRAIEDYPEICDAGA